VKIPSRASSVVRGFATSGALAAARYVFHVRWLLNQRQVTFQLNLPIHST
jgi:hypothetical protein